MPSTNSAPCPFCKAMNLAHRRGCWKCKRTLPVSFGIDARRFTAAKMPRTTGPLPPLPPDVANQTKAPQGREKPADTNNANNAAKGIGWMLIKPAVKSA